MEKTFHAASYVARIGRELVTNFGEAGLATTPGQVGSAREVPTRKKLEQLLPRGIAVGSGCVIDSFGNTSQQIDVILYERDICPEYSINDDPATTYYPCEGVIAVGEIKSEMSSSELKDVFDKSASVRRLRRYVGPLEDSSTQSLSGYPFRKYGSPLTFGGAESEEYSQETKSSDQIYCFSLAGSFKLVSETICQKYVEFSKEVGLANCPNLVVSLEDGKVLSPLRVPEDRHNPTIVNSLLEATGVYVSSSQGGSFQFLLTQLYRAYRSGRTVELSALDRYFCKDGILELASDGVLVELE